MSTGQYIIGIDLGTTNTVVSFAEKSEQATIKLLAIHQMVEEGATGTELSLPSVAFVESGLPGDPKSDLPWSNEGLIVGKLARQLSATRSESCIHSAKSWLSYSGIDRSTRCLPWGSSESHRKYSPLEISSQFLAQVVGSWSQQFPKHPIAKQEVILTVPASFDDTARRLTVEAARKAGLTGSLYLLEEPQAAFYDQLEMNRSRFESGDTILVVDVGGGTTDLTLIESQGAQSGTAEGFKRIAVGPHLLLGGDNMDLLLAYEAERRIIGRNGSLNSKLMSQLVSNCRNMKESAFVAGDNDEFTVSLPSRGSRLIQGTRNCRFSRSEVIGLLTEAFVPSCQFDELADKSRGLALSALGLPYEQEPVLTKHIASFLKKHSQYAFPRHVLFNGGVFRGTPIRDALFSAIENWGTALGISTQILPEGDLDRSVSRGATRYGLARHNFGERIGGGIAHNYFLSVEKRNKKGKRKGQSSICILPKGTPNTTTLKLPDQTFSLIAGRPIRMKVKCGGVKRVDLGASSLIEETEFITLPPVTTVVEAHEDSQHVPVTLSACMSELGLLELRAHAIDRDKTFQFEFDSSAVSLPENGYPLDDARLEPPKGMDEVEHLLLRIFGKPDPTADPKEIRRLFKLLETHVGSPRESWSLSTLRSTFDLLIKGVKRRRRSERHEMSFLYLAGYCLRPGLGDSFDEWRVDQLWKLFPEGVHFHQRLENWDAWWIAWRRISGGLSKTQQEAIYAQLSPWLLRVRNNETTKKDKLKQAGEAWRLLASLERLPIEAKIEWGHRFLETIISGQDDGTFAWCLARLGAREMVYASAADVVGARHAKHWVEKLLDIKWLPGGMMGHCLVAVSRCTGDRERDLAPDLRKRVCLRLEEEGVDPSWISGVAEPTLLRVEETQRLLGDQLPDGLRIII